MTTPPQMPVTQKHCSSLPHTNQRWSLTHLRLYPGKHLRFHHCKHPSQMYPQQPTSHHQGALNSNTRWQQLCHKVAQRLPKEDLFLCQLTQTTTSSSVTARALVVTRLMLSTWSCGSWGLPAGTTIEQMTSRKKACGRGLCMLQHFYCSCQKECLTDRSVSTCI